MSEKKVSGYCPHCCKDVYFESHWIAHANPEKSDFSFLYNVLQCPVCERYLIQEIKKSRPKGDFLRADFYPNLLSKQASDDIPEYIRNDFNEAYLCFSVGAYKAAAVMTRRALEECCEEQGANGKRLVDKIDDLASKGHITIRLKKFAHTVRYVGNDAAHEREVSKDDAEAVLNLLELLTHDFYVAEAIVQKINSKGEK